MIANLLATLLWFQTTACAQTEYELRNAMVDLGISSWEIGYGIIRAHMGKFRGIAKESAHCLIDGLCRPVPYPAAPPRAPRHRPLMIAHISLAGAGGVAEDCPGATELIFSLRSTASVFRITGF